MFTLTTQQKSELQALYDAAVAGDQTQNDVWGAAYNKLYEFMTEVTVIPGDPPTIIEAPADEVDHEVWLWVRGARLVNADFGPFADLIRGYTNIQYELREGSTISETTLNTYSNGIAQKFIDDFLANGQPSISKTGEFDAGEIAAGIFGDNYSPWAGTLLFTHLGYDQFWRDWVLDLGTSEQKKESGTYDLIAAAQAIQDFSVWSGLSWEDLWSAPEAVGIFGQLTVYAEDAEATEGYTNDWFANVYGLDSSDYEYTVGSDTIPQLAAITNLGKSAHYAVGSYGNDEIGEDSNDQSYVTGDEDIVQGGRGNDTVHATAGNDLIDGGEGIDAVQYALGGEIRFEQKGQLGGRLTVEKTDSSGESVGVDLLYSVESLVFDNAQKDTLIIDNGLLGYAQQHGLSIDLGGNPTGQGDVVDITATAGAEVDLRNPNQQFVRNITTGDTLQLKNAEEVKGSDQNDVIKTGATTYLVDAGGGADRVDSRGATAIYLGDGNDALIHAGSGSIVHGGAGDDVIGFSNNILFADADADDRIEYAGHMTLTGGTRWKYSDSPYAVNRSGNFGYGKNPDGELVIHSFREAQGGADMLVSKYEGGPGAQYNTAGIYIVEDDAEATHFANEWPSGYTIVNTWRYLFGDFMKANFGVSYWADVDPLVLDLDGDGLELTAETSVAPMFDMDADDYLEHTGWVRPDDGILVRDANANGVIDDVSELFGGTGVSGFAALSAFDGNSDDVIDSNDSVFADLRLWRDLDGDAVADTGELQTLADAGIESISLQSTAASTWNEGKPKIIDGLLAQLAKTAFNGKSFKALRVNAKTGKREVVEIGPRASNVAETMQESRA